MARMEATVHRLMILLSAVTLACAPPAASDRNNGNNGGNGAGRQDAGPTPPPADAGNAQGTDAGTTPPNPGNRLEPGSACSCSNECFGTDINPGACVLGVCMQEASAECGSSGSTAECDRGSRCWGMQGLDGSICWPDCDAFSCAGECDSDGSCVPSGELNSPCELHCQAGWARKKFTSGSCLPAPRTYSSTLCLSMPRVTRLWFWPVSVWS